jgi:KDO2-lipid IV(A) lauroyltransferase
MLPHKNILKDIGRLLFWFPVRWTIQLMPFRFVYSLGTLFGMFDYYVSGRSCILRIKANLSRTLAYSSKKSDQIVKRNLQHHSRNVIELIKYPQINKENMSQIIRFKGLQHLDRELERGKGVILMTGHFGAKQILQVGLGLRGYPLTQLNYHMGSDEITWVQKNISQKYRIRIENKIPVKFISSQGFLGSAVKALLKNEVLLVAGDGIGIKAHMEKGYRSYPFLGRSMLFPTGAYAMAKRTGAGLVPVFAVREGHRHIIVVERPVDPCLAQDYATRQYIRILEQYVRQYPDLWEFWEEFEQGILIE